MNINLADGNSLSRIDIRAVWVGLFKINRRGSLNINRLTNKTRDWHQYSFCLRGSLLISKPSNWSPKHGNAIRLYGDGAPNINKANSSSCGELQSNVTLSKVLVLGMTQEKRVVTTLSVRRKCWGQKHWYVVGDLNSEKEHSNSCKRVVPLLQWPIIKIGDSELDKVREGKPFDVSQRSAIREIRVWRRAKRVDDIARPNLLAEIALMLPSSKPNHALRSIPIHKRGLHNG